MKKITLLIALFVVLMLNAQKITIPDTWTDASSENLDQLTEWVVKGELAGVAGTKEFYISSSWSPSNVDLNAIASAGGDTEDWPLYWIVNDTNFFYSTVDPSMGENIIAIKSSINTPLKTWGEYLKQSHEIYYRSATNPDQYWILAADVNGNLLTLSEVIEVRSTYSEIIGYVTLPTVVANGDKIQRNTSTGLF